jgi:hypothetical protein
MPATCSFSILRPCNNAINAAAAVPLGNFNFSRTITCLLNGTANTAPKNANPAAHTTNVPNPNLNGAPSSPANKNSNAGSTPTKPAPSGIVPAAPATDCTSTFSAGVNGEPRRRKAGRARKSE